MKYLSIVAICLFSMSVFASKDSFDIQIDLSMDGRHVTSSKLVINNGEKGSIVHEKTGEKIFLEVVATDGKAPDGQPAVDMIFEIGRILNNGQRSIISQPRIMALEGEKAEITVGDQNQNELISLSVLANKANREN